MTRRRAVSLDDKYALEEGETFLTGIQALVRLPMEQARRDRRAGLRTGTMISGYPGSPLGGYDAALDGVAPLLEQHAIRHVHGINEETAAAAVWGSQLLDLFPHQRFDGVTGIWYGKTPGVDRCGDVFRHANYGGGSGNCGIIALAGDDPVAKSSTLPGGSEWAFVSCGMPVLAPSSISEFLELGLHAINLSRYSGLWVALKVVTNLCDGGATIDLAKASPTVVLPELEIAGKPFAKPNTSKFLAPATLELERHLFEERFPAAHAYARVNGLDRVVVGGSDRDRVGVITAGKAHSDFVQAVEDAGLTMEALADLGVRVLKLGMIYPLEPEAVRSFARGLDEVVVVEEKRDLVEGQLKSILYDLDRRPAIVGKRDGAGDALLPVHGELTPEIVVERVLPRLFRGERPAALAGRLEELAAVERRPAMPVALRLPNYCSGCPHSRSTVAVGDELIGGGIGCHGMAPLMSQDERQVLYTTPMGAEGSPWIGASAFVDVDHIFQNVGDGTFFHSASQSLRQAVSAGVNITFKILHNGHIAMTGGQDITGDRDVPTLTRYLESEGVKSTIVVAEEPERYSDLGPLAANAKLYDRERYADAVRELRETPGVTVLLFDQECAAEKRRARKRGKQPKATKFVVINEDACEGCGDCGEKSNCMSVQPVDTELGRKTQIDQASCNQDYSCLKGDCPSFLTVYTNSGGPSIARRELMALDGDAVPEPAVKVDAGEAYRAYIPGVGGTGVVTTNQVLAFAAVMEGKHVLALDQTGLAQKGGSVLSSLVIADRPLDYLSNKVGLGQADLVIALDIQGMAADGNVDRCSPDRTVVVGDLRRQPTAEEIRHVDLLAPSVERLREKIDSFSRRDDNVWVDAGTTTEQLFGDQTKVNTFMVGVAYQAGLIPLEAESIEDAYRLNRVDAERNVQAFRYGRLSLADPARLEQLVASPDPARPAGVAAGADAPRPVGAQAQALLDRCVALDDECRRLLSIRVPDLVDYQDADYASSYVDTVLRVAEREDLVTPGRTELTEASVRYLYKLMAYKDEYEVARLLLRDAWGERVRTQFPDAKVKFNLHPPLLRSRGLDRKLELGAWFRPMLRMLVPLRRVRGTALDPFGRAEVRRQERELIVWYRGLLETLLASLSPHNHALAVDLARTPDRIRGYEDIKLRRIEEAKASVDARLGELEPTSRAA